MDSLSKIFVLFVSFGMLTACGGVGANGASLWIAVPVHSLEIPLSDEIHIEGHTVNTDEALSVEIWANGQLLVTLDDLVDQGELMSFEYDWTPTISGEYLISASAHNAGEELRGQDSVLVRVVDQVSQAPTEQTPVEGKPTEQAPTAIVTEEICEPSVTAVMNANCRFGPESVFEVLGYLLEGEAAPIEGRLADNSWWLIPNPDRAGQCWIASNVVEAECVTESIPIVIPPPTPVPEPEDTTPPPVPVPVYPVGGQSLACMAQVTLAWDPVSDESGIATHQVRAERSPDNASWSAVGGSPWTTGEGNKHTFNVECGWYYRWRVHAEDGEGNRSGYSSWSAFSVQLP